MERLYHQSVGLRLRDAVVDKLLAALVGQQGDERWVLERDVAELLGLEQNRVYGPDDVVPRERFEVVYAYARDGHPAYGVSPLDTEEALAHEILVGGGDEETPSVRIERLPVLDCATLHRRNRVIRESVVVGVLLAEHRLVDVAVDVVLDWLVQRFRAR